MRARRGVGCLGCEPGRVRARMREQGPQASARGRGGRSPHRGGKVRRAGSGSRAAARSSEAESAPELRGRASLRLRSFHAGAWGAQPPTEKEIRGGWVGRAARSARSAESEFAPMPRGRASPRLRSMHSGAWGAVPPTEKRNPGRVGGAPRAARAHPTPTWSPRPRGRASPREGGPSAARGRGRRGSSLRPERCRRPAVRSPGCGSPAARRALTAARPARVRRGSRGTGPRLRRTAT